MNGLAVDIEALADGFSGVVSVSNGSEIDFERAYGLADRAHGIAADVETRFAIASGAKGLTALVVARLIADGVLSFATSARSVLGADLPLIAAEVTVEHLLAHTSGIGDYVDEDEPVDVPLKVPVSELVRTEDYLPALDGIPTKFPAGARFSYCNGGFVVLALIAERSAGAPFHDLVDELVCRPAGLSATSFLRSDELPGDAALGYLEDGRTNVFHVPVRGSGDGGAYTTVSDLRALWAAMFDGRIVEPGLLAEFTRPRNDVPKEGKRYGLGFWLHATGSGVLFEGYDYGVSFRSAHDPLTGLTYTVLSNTAAGAWPIVQRLDQLLDP